MDFGCKPKIINNAELENILQTLFWSRLTYLQLSRIPAIYGSSLSYQVKLNLDLDNGHYVEILHVDALCHSALKGGNQFWQFVCYQDDSCLHEPWHCQCINYIFKQVKLIYLES